MPTLRFTVLAALAVLIGLPSVATGDASVEIETGVVFSGRNDARSPGDTGTTLSLTDDLSTAASPVFRLRAGVRLGDRHVVTALYAPLQLTARGTVDRDIEFEGALFPAGSPMLAVYRFDSYRLTYRYSFIQRDDLEVAAGITGKIRSAETSLYGVMEGRKTNVGFVPLANVHVEWQPQSSRFGLVFDADALAAPQGRAADVLLAGTWAMSDDAQLRAGYRTLEGGADNDEVYSFAWLHYFVAGIHVQY